MRILPLIALIISVVLLLGACVQPNDEFTPELPDVVTYENHIEPILHKNCVRCHGGDITNKIDLSNYDSIYVNSGSDLSESLIVPGNAQSRLLRLKLNPDPELDNMYKYLNNQIDYDFIYKWIVDDSLRLGF